MGRSGSVCRGGGARKVWLQERPNWTCLVCWAMLEPFIRLYTLLPIVVCLSAVHSSLSPSLTSISTLSTLLEKMVTWWREFLPALAHHWNVFSQRPSPRIRAAFLDPLIPVRLSHTSYLGLVNPESGFPISKSPSFASLSVSSYRY